MTRGVQIIYLNKSGVTVTFGQRLVVDPGSDCSVNATAVDIGAVTIEINGNYYTFGNGTQIRVDSPKDKGNIVYHDAGIDIEVGGYVTVTSAPSRFSYSVGSSDAAAVTFVTKTTTTGEGDDATTTITKDRIIKASSIVKVADKIGPTYTVNG